MRPRLVLVGFVLISALVGLAAPGLGQSAFTVSASPSVDTPDRDVTFQGQTFEVTQLGRVTPGESFSATVGAPSDAAYDVYLYDADRNVLDRHRDPDDATVSFDVPADDANYEPGTYVVAVSHDGGFEAITPVVVTGYGVSIDAPASATRGDRIPVEASLTTIDDSKPIEAVQVAIGSGDELRQYTLSPDGNGEYSATVDLGSLPEGEYSLHVVVQGSGEVLGRQEVLGVSDSRTLTVEQATTAATTSEASGGGSSGGGAVPPSGSSTATAETTTVTTTPGESPSSDAGGSTTGPSSTAVGTTGDGTPERPSTTTDDPVITPNAPTTEGSQTTTPGQPLGVVPPLVALLLAVVLRRRRD